MLYGLTDKRLGEFLSSVLMDVESTSSFEEKLRRFSMDQSSGSANGAEAGLAQGSKTMAGEFVLVVYGPEVPQGQDYAGGNRQDILNVMGSQAEIEKMREQGFTEWWFRPTKVSR